MIVDYKEYRNGSYGEPTESVAIVCSHGYSVYAIVNSRTWQKKMPATNRIEMNT